MSAPTKQIPVRKLFWDALEMALEAQTHRLAKDIATALGESEAPLLKALREEKVKAYLFEEPADEEIDDLSEHRCKHYTQVGPFVRVCEEPVVWSSRRFTECCLHHTLHPAPRPPEGLRDIVVPLLCEGATYYVNKETKAVYDEAGSLRGRLSEGGGQVTLFEVEG